MVKLDASQAQEFLDSIFAGNTLTVEATGNMYARMRMKVEERHLRPGNTVSGPAMMGLADAAFYIATLAQIGPVALAVTTNFNINFLRKPGPTDIIAVARIFKLGQRLSIGEVSIFSEGQDELVAHATVTYSIPPDRS